MNNWILKEKKLFKNKAYCLQIGNLSKKQRILFNFQLLINRNEDHAGFDFSFEFFKFYFFFQIYDIRHWDYKNEKWR